ncbi:hypothetical protein D3Z51_09085 [Clostridiaceae bacterium]|nr:hypothetical protein [Clostridiaceae bacterium]RKI14411.1 hypothetical protein D7V81_08570 [bacterium 1XD21-70]
MAEGKIVKVVKSGGVTMYFHDDYCRDKTPEEVKAILDRVAAIVYPALKSAHIRKGKAGPA